MKRALSILFLFLVFGFAQTSYAQTQYDDHARFLFGTEGGGAYGNGFWSLDAGVQIPFAKRIELDLRDSISPWEYHVALGQGWANTLTAGGTVWITPNKAVGINGRIDYSSYSVSIAKGSYYAYGGATWRLRALGLPTRFTFDYFRQIDNGIACGNLAGCLLPDANGTETDHVQGGDWTFDVRMKKLGPTILHLTLDASVGHVLTQGNQFCDGSLGVYLPACKRGSVVSGGVTVGVLVEFSRHHEIDHVF